MIEIRLKIEDNISVAINFFRNNIAPSLITTNPPKFVVMPLSELATSSDYEKHWDAGNKLSETQLVDCLLEKTQSYNYHDFQLVKVLSGTLCVLVLLNNYPSQTELGFHVALPSELSIPPQSDTKNKMYLDNKYRKFLGLAEVLPSWTRLEVCNEVFYHDGESLLKEIRHDKDGYFECDLNESLPEKFNRSVIEKFKPNIYFSYSSQRIKIGNIASQRTYIEDVTDDLEQWLNTWMNETTETDLAELEKFSKQSKSKQKYSEGDFFAFKLSRRQWGFGRIIYDIHKRKKSEEFVAGKNYGLSNLLGHPLIVQVYHHISSTPDITIEELKGKKMLPSQPIFDNRFLYGDYRIIGNAPVEMSEIIPLESFGRSLDANDPFWYVQYDFTYREKRKHPFLISKEYKNESIGFGLRVNEKLINDCIASDSNDPYWKQDYFYIREDLRSPANAKIRRRIFRYFGI